MQTLNPYLIPILKELDKFFDSFPLSNEYQIIKHLQTHDIAPFNHFSLSNTKDLFSAHFLYMHALYHLKNHYFNMTNVSEAGEPVKLFSLVIESIRVERVTLENITEEKNTCSLNNKSQCTIEIIDPLESYYLDSANYFDTQEDEINDLLKSFWQKYIAQDKKQGALTVLNLPLNADNKMIKTKYLQLAQKYHPDKGGCAETFIKIKQAKTVLDNC